MNKKLQILAALGLMSAMAMPSGRGTNDGSYGHGVPEEKPKVIPKGCKEFTIHGFTVIAMNKKSALRKIKKLITKQG